MDNKDSTGWVIDVLIGVLAGGAIGLIAAVNIVIFAGPDDGYQSSVSDVFEQTPATGMTSSPRQPTSPQTRCPSNRGTFMASMFALARTFDSDRQLARVSASSSLATPSRD